MSYVDERIPRTSESALGGELTQVHPRRAEGVSTRRLVLALDVLVLLSFVVAHQDVASVAYAGLTLLALKAARVYGPRIMPKVGDDLPRIVAAGAVPVLLLPLITTDAELGAIVTRVPLVLLTLLVGRSLTYAILHRARATGARHERALIVGAGDRGLDLARLLSEHPEYGIEPVGFVDELALGELPLPLYGGIQDLPRLAETHGVGRVMVAEWDGEDRDLVPAIRACTERHIHVHVAPRLFQLGAAPTTPSTDWIWTTPLVRLPESPQTTRAWRLKRAMDAGFGGLLLFLTSPLYLVIAAAIRLSGRGPILFRQVRLTQDGREFELLKFRTLPVNDTSDTSWGAGDLRPTAVGRLLRKTGLDEMPQLINIVRGDMSLVGPRPERPFFVERFSAEIEGYDDRLRVPAGLTGWAQVHGLRGDTSIEERSMFDNEYIEYWSLWRDVVILVRTVKTFVAGEGR
jgi:exopolysaccharide biosynthesis polyprenyl glycosylphosphotransferase